jgi:hypothetical protein
VIAGKEHTLVLEQEACVIRDVSRRKDDPEPDFRAVDVLAVREPCIRSVARILVRVLRRWQPQDTGTGPCAQFGGAGRMIGMRMRTYDAIDRGAGHIEDAIEMRGILRAGIDHDRPVASEHIRVGAGPGQRAWIRRNDAPHEGGDA